VTEQATNSTPQAPEAPKPPPESAAEPTLKQRSEELRQAARQEQAKLRAREAEKAELVEARRQAKEGTEAAKKLAALEERLSKDALGLLNERGVKARDIGERIMREGTPDAKLEELNAKIRLLEETRDKEHKQAEEKAQRLERERMVESARKELHKRFEDLKPSLPILSALCKTEARFEREYMAAYQTIASEIGVEAASQLKDDDIIKAMEEAKAGDREAYIESFDAESIEKVLTKKRSSATVDEKASAGSVRQGSENASSPAKTLTNAQAASRTTAEGEFDIRKGESLADADKRQNALLVERLRAGRRG
jgi:hypothetical protein